MDCNYRAINSARTIIATTIYSCNMICSYMRAYDSNNKSVEVIGVTRGSPLTVSPPRIVHWSKTPKTPGDIRIASSTVLAQWYTYTSRSISLFSRRLNHGTALTKFSHLIRIEVLHCSDILRRAIFYKLPTPWHLRAGWTQLRITMWWRCWWCRWQCLITPSEYQCHGRDSELATGVAESREA